MVAVTAIGLWTVIAALLASSARVLKPRLPLYKLKTVKLFNLGMSWSKREIKATWRGDVSLFNENYIKADVHGVRVDMYYPTWDGQELTHIGHVRDPTFSASSVNQQLCDETLSGNSKDCVKSQGRDNVPINSIATTSNGRKTENTARRKKPLWSLRPRQEFEATDDLTMTLFQLPTRTMGNLLWSVLTKGRLVIPSTGAAHVRATGGAQMTIGMICDNVVEIWSQSIVGRDCSVNGVTTGWINLDKEHLRLQKQAFQRHDKAVA